MGGEGESLSTQILSKYVNTGVKVVLPLYYARCGIPFIINSLTPSLK
jgi:hypothetical protein